LLQRPCFVPSSLLSLVCFACNARAKREVIV
jgi:hypothetical protein